MISIKKMKPIRRRIVTEKYYYECWSLKHNVEPYECMYRVKTNITFPEGTRFVNALAYHCPVCSTKQFMDLDNNHSISGSDDFPTISPSVGLVGIYCRSHYYIKKGYVEFCNDSDLPK